MSETMRPDKFIILRGLSKHGSIAISDLNFSGWINNKHKVFRRRKTLFPTLIFRIRKHFSMSQQFLPKNATALMENRVRYSGKHSLSKIHLRLDVLTIFKDWAKKDEVSSKSRRIGLSRFYSLCIHPGSYFPEYKSHLEFTVNPIFSETSNILADAKHGKPGSSPSGIAPPFPKPPRTYQDKSHTSGKSVTKAVGHEYRGEAYGCNLPWQFIELPHTDQDETHTSGKSASWTVWHKHIYREKIAQPPVSDSPEPTLHFHSPVEVALNGLKESVVDIEKKLSEQEGFIEKIGAYNPSISDHASDIVDNRNINIGYLTDQVYQMLERRIIIEKERKGW